MKWLLVLLVLSEGASAAPLWDAELDLGYGIAVGAGTGSEMKRSPLTLGGRLAIAIDEENGLAAYGGFMFESVDRSSAGLQFGVRVRPDPASRLRLMGGGTWIVAPYSLWGATAAAGACGRSRRAICGDAMVTAYVAGADLAENHVVVQAQLVLGFSFAGP